MSAVHRGKPVLVPGGRCSGIPEDMRCFCLTECLSRHLLTPVWSEDPASVCVCVSGGRDIYVLTEGCEVLESDKGLGFQGRPLVFKLGLAKQAAGVQPRISALQAV